LKILIVEDEPSLATTLKHLIELNPRFHVTDIADDLESALRAVEELRPDLAMVDLQLARGSSGFNVAVKLNDLGIACLFTSGKAPSFPMPDLALGCLAKPYGEKDVARALKIAEGRLRGRRAPRRSRSRNLHIYPQVQASDALTQEEKEEGLTEQPRRSLRHRLRRWLSAS
jgi:DNA-binding response OmpR family regulator